MEAGRAADERFERHAALLGEFGGDAGDSAEELDVGERTRGSVGVFDSGAELGVEPVGVFRDLHGERAEE